MMATTPASAIKDQLSVLIDAQNETFGQPAPLTPSQLRESQDRSEKHQDALPRTESDWLKAGFRTYRVPPPVEPDAVPSL